MRCPHPDILPTGFCFEVHKTVTATDIHLWARQAGYPSPVRGEAAFAQQRFLEHTTAPNAYLTSLAADTATRLAAYLPCHGVILETLRVHFTVPVFVGTILRDVVTVIAWDAVAGLYWLDIRVLRADGTQAALGTAWIRPGAPHLPPVEALPREQQG